MIYITNDVKVMQYNGKNLEEMALYLGIEEIEQDFLDTSITIHNKGQSFFVKSGQFVVKYQNGFISVEDNVLIDYRE